MRHGIFVDVSAADRSRLEAVVADRNSPQKHVWRSRIVLLTGAGVGTVEIMRQTGKSKTAIWRWQERFMTAGVDGLLRDKTRPSRVPPRGREVVPFYAFPGDVRRILYTTNAIEALNSKLRRAVRARGHFP